jgi:hypothetical protein
MASNQIAPPCPAATKVPGLRGKGRMPQNRAVIEHRGDNGKRPPDKLPFIHDYKEEKRKLPLKVRSTAMKRFCGMWNIKQNKKVQ